MTVRRTRITFHREFTILLNGKTAVKRLTNAQQLTGRQDTWRPATDKNRIHLVNLRKPAVRKTDFPDQVPDILLPLLLPSLPGEKVTIITFSDTEGNMNVDSCWTIHCYLSSSSFSTLINAFCGISTFPIWRIRFFPSFCFSSNFFFLEISPP